MDDFIITLHGSKTAVSPIDIRYYYNSPGGEMAIRINGFARRIEQCEQEIDTVCNTVRRNIEKVQNA